MPALATAGFVNRSGVIISLISERNIVFHVVELAGRLLRRRCGRLGGAARSGLAAVGHFGAWLAATFAPSEHLHDVGANLGAVAILAVLVLPLARAQAALDIHLRAFLQVFAGDFGQAPEERDAVPFGGFLHLAARLVLPFVGRRHADVGHRLAAGQEARFRIGSQIADDDYLVYRSHFTPPSNLSVFTTPPVTPR